MNQGKGLPFGGWKPDRPLAVRVRYDLYRRRFLWRLAFIRFLRLCLLILVLRRFLRQPMVLVV